MGTITIWAVTCTTIRNIWGRWIGTLGQEGEKDRVQVNNVTVAQANIESVNDQRSDNQEETLSTYESKCEHLHNLKVIYCSPTTA